jgi:hypothetical protein
MVGAPPRRHAPEGQTVPGGCHERERCGILSLNDFRRRYSQVNTYKGACLEQLTRNKLFECPLG